MQLNVQQRSALDQIKTLVGPQGWLEAPADVAPYLQEPRGHWTGTTALVVRPAATADVAAVVKHCAAARLPIVPQGGNTSLCGGAVPFDGDAGIVLSLSRMNRIRSLDPANDTMTVDAGCVLQTIQTAAADADRLFPLSLGAEGSCQIGGNIATNAGGVQVLRYGNMRDQVLGLEVVLPDGSIWDGLRGLRKDNTGYDLKHWFIGAEGTLGVITGAVLKLHPRPRDVVTALVAIRDPQAAVDLLGAVRQETGNAVTSFEILGKMAMQMALDHGQDTRLPISDGHDWYLLIELAGQRVDGSLRAGMENVLAAGMESGAVRDAALAESGAQRAAFWRLREAVPEAQSREGASIKHDVAVPISKVPEFLARGMAAVEAAMPGLRPVPFGHVGDGNIHFNLSQPKDMDKHAFLAEWDRMNRLVHDLVVELGGTISAEHGIGRLKIDALAHYHSASELAAMRAIKAALDPDGIMNPGKVLRL